MGIFDSLFNGSSAKGKEFTPRDNSTLGLSKNGSSSGMFPRKGNTRTEAEQKDDRLFSYSNSTAAPKDKTRKYVGTNIKNSSLMSAWHIDGTEGLKKVAAGISGDGPFCHADTMRHDAKLLKEGGDVKKLSFYSKMPKPQQDALRNRSDVRRDLGKILEKSWKK